MVAINDKNEIVVTLTNFTDESFDQLLRSLIWVQGEALTNAEGLDRDTLEPYQWLTMLLLDLLPNSMQTLRMFGNSEKADLFERAINSKE